MENQDVFDLLAEQRWRAADWPWVSKLWGKEFWEVPAIASCLHLHIFNTQLSLVVRKLLWQVVLAGCLAFQNARGGFPIWSALRRSPCERGGHFFISKFPVHFSLVKNCPEFLTTTAANYFYLTFLLSLWPTAIPMVQKNSRVLHRISTDVSTEKLCAENSLFHVYSCPEMTKFKFTYEK